MGNLAALSSSSTISSAACFTAASGSPPSKPVQWPLQLRGPSQWQQPRQPPPPQRLLLRVAAVTIVPLALPVGGVAGTSKANPIVLGDNEEDGDGAINWEALQAALSSDDDDDG